MALTTSERANCEYISQCLNSKKVDFKIVKVEKECYKDTSIANGVIKIWVKYDVNHHQHVLDLADVHQMGPQKAHIQIAGMPPKCMHCHKFGHIRAKCTLYKMFCTKCNVRGHTEGNGCTIATHLAGLNNNQVEYDDLDAPPEENTSSPVLNQGHNTHEPEGDEIISTQREFVFNDQADAQVNEQMEQNGHDEEQNEPVFRLSSAQDENLSDSSYSESNNENYNGEKNAHKRYAEKSPSNFSHEQDSSLLNDTASRNMVSEIENHLESGKPTPITAKAVDRKKQRRNSLESA